MTNEWNLRCKYCYYGNETKYTNEYKDKNSFKFNIPALLRFISSFNLKDDLMIPLLWGIATFLKINMGVKVKYANILLILILSLTIISCAKDKTFVIENVDSISYVHNLGEPSDETFNIRFDKELSIGGYNEMSNDISGTFYSVSQLKISSDGLIFINDDSSFKIYKYSPSGVLLDTLNYQGSGPGELTMPAIMSLLDNYLVLTSSGIANYYDFDLKFVEKHTTPFTDITYTMFSASNDRIIQSCFTYDKRGDSFPKDYWVFEKIKKIDLELSTISELDFKLESYFPDHYKGEFIEKFRISKGEDEFYLAVQSKTTYAIDVYDYDFNHKMKIEFPFEALSFTEEEIDFLKKQYPQGTEDFSMLYNYYDYKLAISNLYYDSASAYLFVERPQELATHSVKFDVFKEGVYLNSFNFTVNEESFNPLAMGFNFYIFNSNLYYYDNVENRISIYQLVF